MENFNQELKLIGEGRNHKVFSDGKGKVYRVSKKE